MYIKCDPWAICDRCGFKFRKSQTRKTWDNLIVCHKDWEPKNQLDYAVPIREQNFVKDARPEPADRFLSDNEITPESL